MLADSAGPEALSDFLRAEFLELFGDNQTHLDATLKSISVAADFAVEHCRAASLHTVRCQQAWASAIAAQVEASAHAHRLLEVARIEIARVPGRQHNSVLNISGRDAPSALRVCLFGEFELQDQTGPIEMHTLRGTKSWAILQLLALHRKSPVGRDALIEAIWPEVHPDEGRRRLHQAIYALRQALNSVSQGRLMIEFSRGAYRLKSSLEIVFDVEEFELLAGRGGHRPDSGQADPPPRFGDMRRAEQLYRGDLLSDIEAEWADSERDRLRRKYVNVACDVAEQLFAIGDAAGSNEVWERVRQRDPWHEAATRGIMRSLVKLGQPSLALRVFADSATQLDRDLGVKPSRDTVVLHDSIMDNIRDNAQTRRGPDRRNGPPTS